MALKQFIVTQTVNYAGRGDKTSTHRISMDEGEMAGYVALLDGQVRVFAEDLALSDTTSSTASSSVDTVSRIFIKHGIGTMIVLAIVLNEKLTINKIIGILIAFFGLVYLLYTKDGFTLSYLHIF